jgi:hydroxyacylglutathione hydrolase
MLQLKLFTFNPFQENTYILFDETKEAVIFDPGCYEREENDELANFISSEGLKVTHLINTHCHIDHVLGNAFVKNKYKVPLLIHQKEIPVLNSVKVYAPNYGFPRYQEAEPDGYLDEKEKIQVWQYRIGHSFCARSFPWTYGVLPQRFQNMYCRRHLVSGKYWEN